MPAAIPPALGGALVAEVENFGLWPLGRASDRFHPARGELPRLTGNRRALAQATWRHLLFGLVLGELERRLNGATRAPRPGGRGAVVPSPLGEPDSSAGSARRAG
jgi:hypothetical protein